MTFRRLIYGIGLKHKVKLRLRFEKIITGVSAQRLFIFLVGSRLYLIYWCPGKIIAEKTMYDLEEGLQPKDIIEIYFFFFRTFVLIQKYQKIKAKRMPPALPIS